MLNLIKKTEFHCTFNVSSWPSSQDLAFLREYKGVGGQEPIHMLPWLSSRESNNLKAVGRYVICSTAQYAGAHLCRSRRKRMRDDEMKGIRI